MKTKDCIEQLKQLDVEKSILAQVVDPLGHAFGVEFEFASLDKCSFNVLTLKHRDLKDLYHIRPFGIHQVDCGNKLLEKIFDLIQLMEIQVRLVVAPSDDTVTVYMYNYRLEVLTFVIRKSDNAFVMMPAGSIIYQFGEAWKTKFTADVVAFIFDFLKERP